jgi:hypothetical protein
MNTSVCKVHESIFISAVVLEMWNIYRNVYFYRIFISTDLRQTESARKKSWVTQAWYAMSCMLLPCKIRVVMSQLYSVSCKNRLNVTATFPLIITK